MYWYSIFWIFTWIILVVVSYLLIAYIMRKYESFLEKPVKKLQAKNLNGEKVKD